VESHISDAWSTSPSPHVGPTPVVVAPSDEDGPAEASPSLESAGPDDGGSTVASLVDVGGGPVVGSSVAVHGAWMHITVPSSSATGSGSLKQPAPSTSNSGQAHGSTGDGRERVIEASYHADATARELLLQRGYR
jgi:hypothetical protein